jgi:hypothetical protein
VWAVLVVVGFAFRALADVATGLDPWREGSGAGGLAFMMAVLGFPLMLVCDLVSQRLRLWRETRYGTLTDEQYPPRD